MEGTREHLCRCHLLWWEHTSVLFSVLLKLLLAQESSCPSHAHARSSSVTHQHPQAHQPKLHLMENLPEDWPLFPVETPVGANLYEKPAVLGPVCSGWCQSGAQPGLCHSKVSDSSARGPHWEGGTLGSVLQASSLWVAVQSSLLAAPTGFGLELLPQTNHHLCYPYSRGHGPSIILPS